MNHTAITMIILLIFAAIGGILVVIRSRWGGLGFLMLIIGGLGMLLIGFGIIPA